MDAECESGNCGSRRFQVGEDGFTYCSEGHRQSQSGLIAAEDDGLQPIGRRTIRKHQDDQNPAALTGKEGVEHFLVCFQLLLWKQVHSLIIQAGYPAELENIVRDLWTLRLSALQPRLATADKEDDPASRLFSSQGETSDSDALSTRKQTRRGDDALPRILDGVCLIFAASTLLRLPTTINDFHRRIQDGRLIYYRSTQHLNAGMKPVLAGFYHHLLDPREKLRLAHLQAAIIDTMSSFTTTFDLSFPPLNHHLHLWHLLQSLCLPLEIYPCTLRLANLLSIDFSYPTASSTQRPTSSLGLPEHRLTALLLIATKLLFPPDGHSRPPRKPTEPAALSMDWQHWAQLMRSRSAAAAEAKSAFRTALDTSARDVLALSEQRLDEYVAWFGGMYAKEGAGDPLARTLAGLFPVSMAVEEGGREERTGVDNTGVREVQGKLRPVRVLADVGGEEGVDRPGAGYTRFYRAEELNGMAREVYTFVAREAGMEVENLVRDVYTLEKGLEKLAGAGRQVDEDGEE